MSISEFATEKAYKSYIEYMAVKKHFDTPAYDYFKSAGKVKCGFNKFASRSDVIHFNRAGRLDNFRDLLVANLSLNTKLWIVDILDENGMSTLRDFKSKIQRMSYLVAQSSKNVLKKDFAENFVINGDDYPFLMEMLLQNEISLELFTVLVNKARILPYWEEKLGGKFFVKDIIHRSKKLYPFLQIDHKKINQTIKENFVI